MSINLTLVFDQFGLGGDILGYSRLALQHQDYDLFDAIRAEATPMSVGVRWYGDEGLELCDLDPYGDKLTCISAFRLECRLAGVELGPWDRAVLAFVKTLPRDARVILWWH
jgi:hypothetical protein